MLVEPHRGPSLPRRIIGCHFILSAPSWKYISGLKTLEAIDLPGGDRHIIRPRYVVASAMCLLPLASDVLVLVITLSYNRESRVDHYKGKRNYI